MKSIVDILDGLEELQRFMKVNTVERKEVILKQVLFESISSMDIDFFIILKSVWGCYKIWKKDYRQVLRLSHVTDR